MTSQLSWWADIRHWVLGVEASPDEIAFRLVWFTILIQRRTAAKV